MTRMLALAMLALVFSEHDCGKAKLPAGVICSPCTEIGPPAGYQCAGQIMVNAAVPNKDIPKWQRACSQIRNPKK